MAALGQEAAGLVVTTARAQLLFDVTQAYYDAALSDRLVAIAEASFEQSGATLRQTEAGFNAGTQPEFEVLRARVTRDNQTPLVIRQRVNRELALLRLKQMLDLPADYDLRLADALGDEQLAPAPAFAARITAIEERIRATDPVSLALTVQTEPLPNRTAVVEAVTTLRLREASLALTEAQRRPDASLNSTYSRIAYPSAVFPVFDRANWSIGAAINVPILTGGRQRGDEQVARAQLDQARIQLRQVEELAALDTRSAWAELLAARAAWESSAGTVQQAGRAFEIADVRYRAGVSTQLELTDSQLQLRQAEANRAQAARNLQVARARVALLPDLPLAAGAALSPPLLQAPPAPAPSPQPGNIRNAALETAPSQAGTR
jgi:outer membrane protein TolC